MNSPVRIGIGSPLVTRWQSLAVAQVSPAVDLKAFTLTDQDFQEVQVILINGELLRVEAHENVVPLVDDAQNIVVFQHDRVWVHTVHEVLVPLFILEPIDGECRAFRIPTSWNTCQRLSLS